MKETIRKALVYWRTKSGLTQLQLSEMLTCKSKTYQSYEDGRATPSVSLLLELCGVYQLDSINDFIFFNHQSSKLNEPSKRDILYMKYVRSGTENRKIIDFILKEVEQR